jgi:archaemetzincin
MRLHPITQRRLSASRLTLLIVALTAHSAAAQLPLEKKLDSLRPLYQPLAKAAPGEWLDSHPEAGQTFKQYLKSKPTTPTARRRVLYVQPLGEFTAGQRKVLTATAEFLGLYFNLPVKVQPDLPLTIIPAEARRTHPTWGVKQIRSTYVLDEVLSDRLPADAMAIIAFTSWDLWPGEGWNFVFGQASLDKRVGVWSLARYGDPDADQESFRKVLVRTLKTATHETGHMFSIPHCTAYACNMNGSNGLEETDRHPLEVCPECLAKICWATKTDPAKRIEKLRDFCRQQNLTEEADFYEKAFVALNNNPKTKSSK